MAPGTSPTLSCRLTLRFTNRTSRGRAPCRPCRMSPRRSPWAPAWPTRRTARRRHGWPRCVGEGWVGGCGAVALVSGRHGQTRDLFLPCTVRVVAPYSQQRMACRGKHAWHGPCAAVRSRRLANGGCVASNAGLDRGRWWWGEGRLSAVSKPCRDGALRLRRDRAAWRLRVPSSQEGTRTAGGV